MPIPLNQGRTGDLIEIGDLTLRQQMQALGLTLSKTNDGVWERLSISLTTPTHPYRPGDAIWVKEQNVQPLKPHWRGPFVVILCIPTIAKVAGIALWIYHSQVKAASLQWECIPDPSSPCNIALWIATPFLSRILLPGRHLGTTNNETTVLL
jgi:hypothetical protein